MRIFEHSHSGDCGPAAPNEPRYEYLSRTGRKTFAKVRELIEEWFADIPPDSQIDIAGRLRSRKDQEFEAAFFELYLHAIFKKLSWQIELHPGVPGTTRRPDFLLRNSEGREMFVEAASVGELSVVDRGAETRLKDAYRKIDRLPSPDYFLNVEHYGELKSNVPKKALESQLGPFLRSLTWEDVMAKAKGGLSSLPHLDFRHGDFRARISPLPKSSEARGRTDVGTLGMHGPGTGRIVDNVTQIRNRIAEKASDHSGVELPLLIAINAAGRDLEHMDRMDALFGREELVFNSSDFPASAEFQRTPNGALAGPRGPQNRSVSAVLFVSSLLPSTIATTDATIYHNPWATRKLEGLLDEMDHWRPEGERMVLDQGRPIRQILGLAADWPGFAEERASKKAKRAC